MSLQATTWQTVGPFFCIGFERLFKADIAGEGVLGERVAVQGRVLDGDGIPIPDAVIEIWQANVHGKYAHPADTQDKPLEQGFAGFGRIPTDETGAFRFTTIKPGSVPGPKGDSTGSPSRRRCINARLVAWASHARILSRRSITRNRHYPAVGRARATSDAYSATFSGTCEPVHLGHTNAGRGRNGLPRLLVLFTAAANDYV